MENSLPYYLLAIFMIVYPMFAFSMLGSDDKRRKQKTEQLWRKITVCEACSSKNYRIDKVEYEKVKVFPVIRPIPGEDNSPSKEINTTTTFTLTCKNCHSKMYEKSYQMNSNLSTRLAGEYEYTYSDIQDKELKNRLLEEHYPRSCSDSFVLLLAWLCVMGDGAMVLGIILGLSR